MDPLRLEIIQLVQVVSQPPWVMHPLPVNMTRGNFPSHVRMHLKVGVGKISDSKGINLFGEGCLLRQIRSDCVR